MNKIIDSKLIKKILNHLNKQEFDYALDTQNLQIEGFELTLKGFPADLDQVCGQYLSYRDLIECGETQAATKSPSRAPSTTWSSSNPSWRGRSKSSCEASSL